MSLFICPDCGNQVSDQAEKCPKCGCPIEYILKHTKETNLNHTDVQNTDIKKRKSFSTSIFIVSACICCVLIFTFVTSKPDNVTSKPDKDGYYKGIEWGTSTSILKNNDNIERMTFNDYEDNQEFKEYIENYNDVLGVSGYIHYYFENDKLYQVKLILNADNNIEGAFEKLREINSKSVQEFKKVFGQQISSGFYHNMWETEKSVINIDMNTDLVISHTDINYSNIIN